MYYEGDGIETVFDGILDGPVQVRDSQDHSPPLVKEASKSPIIRHESQQSPPDANANNEDSAAIEEAQIDPELIDVVSDERQATTFDAIPKQALSGSFGIDVPTSSLDVTVDTSRPVHPALRLAMDTALPASSSASPATPIGLGHEGLYHGYDMSRRGSSDDFDSYVDATKGNSTSLGSESEYDYGMIDNAIPAGGLGDSDPGVPPPRSMPKKSHARKQPEGHIKRARNAFILFRKHITDSNLIPPSVEVKHQNISVVAAKMWREAPQEVRQKFQEQARIEKEEHQRKYPGYRYQPVFRRTDIIRRRVRKDPAEDDKVEAVAEALIKGKVGNDLEKDIKDQMATRSDMSETESDQPARTSRRRRKDAGQLSKGAIRAQRAQARAKAMRQNLLGSNILSMSMYNAAAQANGRMNHPGAQHHLQYAMAEQYLPIGYDMQPIYDQSIYPAQMDAGEMYRLPPIDNVGAIYEGNWTQGTDYWNAETMGHLQEYPVPHPGLPGQQPIANTDYYAPPPLQPGSHHEYALQPGQHPPQGEPGPLPRDLSHGLPAEYQLPPLDRQAHHGQIEFEKHRDVMFPDWARDGQQTPSGHVVFNERLFDGALGSATLPAIGVDTGPRDEGLAGFDEAIAQANDVSHW
ncbi:hypothetical protein BD324DRAFT_612990 [Kockovaella imperatae]|uniref:HMG box domain-containing protein n=1 Tax=Kockovaella imperatae TaxID=4999 RepID=A0A1Y1USP9_9TREE|nr:hypothetical protein BD324DRAFT_612990 [Kockovaella imperatae]ORX41040.1 hypothetical protein BD324DRAFT_612990 [Kockovaella imperatae]